jgi:hypothetical protein
MWTNTLNALARDADSAGMLPCPRKPPRRVDRETPRERILGAWGDVQNALYRATGTPSVIEAGHRLRFRGMSLRITDVILMMGSLREQIAGRTDVSSEDAAAYELLAARAVLSIRQAADRS